MRRYPDYESVLDSYPADEPASAPGAVDTDPRVAQMLHGESNRWHRRDTRNGRLHEGSRRESPVKLFIRRTAQVLDIDAEQVPEVMSNLPMKAARVNRLRLDDGVELQEVEDRLFDDGVDVSPLEWYGSAYTFPARHTDRVQDNALTQNGQLFIQNPSSYLPVFALEPSEGSRVLDMCAAPGGKTSMIAALMVGKTVELVANEPKGRRRERMKEVLGLLGASDVEVRGDDGKHLPNLLGNNTFDRVLVDTECSTEAGINFESNKPLRDWSMERVTRVNVLQKQLITAAYDLLKPGGVLVYSTCTLSPEENEGTVTALLNRRRDAIVQPIMFDAEKNGRKVKSWEGSRFPSEVYDRTLRIFPRDYMEAFFVARVRKPTGSAEVDASFEEPVSLDQIAKTAA